MFPRYPAALCGICCIALSSTGSAEQPVPDVSYSDVGKSVQITGHFGQPLGKLITVEGEVLSVDDPNHIAVKFWPRECEQFLVRRLDGRELDEPLVIPVQFRTTPVPGMRVVLRGHERAEFAGDPPELNRLHTKMGIAPATWRFDVWLYVNEVLAVTL